MNREHRPKPYDPDAARRIERDTGVSPEDAARIAATEMYGAATTPSGDINSTQTYCNNLGSPESLRPSQGAKEGATITRGSAARELGVNISGLSPRAADKLINKATDDWLKNHS